MADAELTTLPPQAGLIAAAIFLAVIVGALAILVWGLAQRRQSPAHRLGGDFGGAPAVVVEWSGEEGLVRVGGELWRARSRDAVAAGDKVRITGSDGLMLEISRS